MTEVSIIHTPRSICKGNAMFRKQRRNRRLKRTKMHIGHVLAVMRARLAKLVFSTLPLVAMDTFMMVKRIV